MKKGGGERFSMEEALAAQQYATDKEGKGFSEKASEGSYAEAKRVIGLLRDKKFDWLGVDWKKVNFRDISADAETRIRAGLETVLATKEKKGKKNPAAATVRKFAPWTAIAAMLVAACSGEPPEEGWEQPGAIPGELEYAGEIFDKSKDDLRDAMGDASLEISEPDLSSANARAAIKEYKDSFPEINRVTIGPGIEKGRRLRSHKSFEVAVTAYLTDGRVFSETVDYETGPVYSADIGDKASDVWWNSAGRYMAATEAAITAISRIVDKADLRYPGSP